MLKRVFAPGHGLSQLVTSFVASESQGILHVPFSPFLLCLEFYFACLRGLSYSSYARFCVGIELSACADRARCLS